MRVIRQLVGFAAVDPDCPELGLRLVIAVSCGLLGGIRIRVTVGSFIPVARGPIGGNDGGSIGKEGNGLSIW